MSTSIGSGTDSNQPLRPRKKVAVIGSGVTGLLIAQGLIKHGGFDVVVYERDAHLHSREKRPISFNIHWGLDNVKALLPEHLWSQISTTYCNPAAYVDWEEVEGITFFQGHTGELLFRSPPAIMRRITRQKLRNLISQGVEIRWGVSFESFEESPSGGVTLRFADGAEETADILVGADGARSKIRHLLLGEEKAAPVASEFVCGYSSALIGKENAERLFNTHPMLVMTYHSMGIIATGVEDAVDPEDPSTWLFNITRIWRGTSDRYDGADAVKVIKENSKTFCDPARSAVMAMPEDSVCFVRQLHHWRPIPWPNMKGTVTLAGDAAHPMLPFRGQGLNQATDDAMKFVKALIEVADGKTLKEAVDAYDAEVVERGAAAFDAAVFEGTLVQDMDKLTQMVVATKGVAK